MTLRNLGEKFIELDKDSDLIITKAFGGKQYNISDEIDAIKFYMLSRQDGDEFVLAFKIKEEKT